MVERPTQVQDRARRTAPARSTCAVIAAARRSWRSASVALILLLVALAALWIARRPIATTVLQREFERRGVEATYQLDRVGLRTQQISNLVIGDPKRPDLTARFAQIQTRIKWNGGVEVYRVVARGVRLRGRIVDGKVSWGQIDKLLPPPTDKPFALPDFVLDVADSSISLLTPVGPLGIALEGAGNLSGGFKGRMAASSPRLVPGVCQLHDLKANVAIAVEARRPHVEGPLQLSRLSCPKSRFEIVEPRFDINSRFNESFTNYDGRGRMAIRTLVASENGLAAFVGNLSFRGNPTATYGSVQLSARQSRLGTIFADRTRLDGRYRLGVTGGTFVFVGDYGANSAALAPSMLAAVTQPLAAAAGTPLGPVATAIGTAVSRTVSNFDATGEIRMVNFPGGGAARIESAEITSPAGARASLSGGRRRHILLAGRPDAHRRPYRDAWRRAADRARAGQPAAQRRADARHRAHRALHGAGIAPGAGADPLRRRPQRGVAGQHRRPARRRFPRRPGARARAADQRDARRGRRLRHGPRLPDGALRISPVSRSAAQPHQPAYLPGGTERDHLKTRERSAQHRRPDDCAQPRRAARRFAAAA